MRLDNRSPLSTRLPIRIMIVTLARALALGLGASLLVACAGIPSYSGFDARQVRMYEAYRVLMSADQQREYDGLRSAEARSAFVDRIGLRQRFEALSEAERQAVVERGIVPGMAADALLMSWGDPYARHQVSAAYEEWIYDAAVSNHLRPGLLVSVDVKHGKVTGWLEKELSDADSNLR